MHCTLVLSRAPFGRIRKQNNFNTMPPNFQDTEKDTLATGINATERETGGSKGTAFSMEIIARGDRNHIHAKA